jgi:type IV secretory pathway VirJ component
MSWRNARAALALLLGLGSISCRVAPAPEPERIEAGRLGSVLLYRPTGSPAGLVVLFSDASGWNAELSTAADEVRAAGVAVIGVDLARYQLGLRGSDDGCHYVVGEIEALSQRVQRQLGSRDYRSPILAGVGQGGTLAYAALAQAPAATIAGAVGVDPAPALVTAVPLCAGAAASAAAGGGFAYAATAALPGFSVVSAARPDERATPADRLAGLLRSRLAADEPTPRDLPIVEIPVAEPHGLLAIIYSGDGGWRDLDKTIAGELAQRGIPVVGVDCLRYFWTAKTPDDVARDLAALIDDYAARWSAPRVLLIGYSFGAGVLPFAVVRLPRTTRASVVLVSLLGLGPRADFQFRPAAWLGAQPGSEALPVMPALLELDRTRLQCFYGEEEEDTLCRDPRLAGAEIISTRGGHHFDGDYAALAARIYAGAMKRASLSAPPSP